MRETSYKLQVPRVGDHVRRDGLLRRLDVAQKHAAITWVVGLPASGKTSLVARWAEGRAAIWYRLDENDADVAPFFDAVGQQANVPLPTWSPENDMADFARHFFAELARTGSSLVLDDCHRIADDAPLFAMLASLHESSGHAVLVSRRGPPPVLARGRIGGWLSVVDDLRLSADEVRAIVEAVRGSAISLDEAASLASTDGWLAQVLTVARQCDTGVRLAEGSAVGAYLAAELLASLPKEQRPSFRRLAELPEIPRDVPAAPEVLRLLGSLAEQRWFVDGTTRGYRLHDLLRDALLADNAKEDDVATSARVRKELAACIAESMPEEALQLRTRAGDIEGVLALLDLHGRTWLARGLHRSIHAWLRELTDGRLDLWRALALLPVEPESARPLFAAARRASAAAGQAADAYEAWCGEVSSYVVQWGAVHGLADLVDELEALEATLGPPPGDLAFRTSADALTALMYGRAEDRRIARYAEATARAVVHAPDAGARIAAAAQLLVYRLWWAGDFPGGRALYDTFDQEVADGDDLPALPRLLWWSCAAIVDWQCGNPEDCYAKVTRGLALADASGVHVRDFFLLTQGIFCALSQEDWPRAQTYLQQLARTERTHKRLDAMVHHFFRSWYSLCRGDPRTALAHAETAWPIADAIGSMFHKVIVLSALAPARVHCGDLEGAQEAYRAQLALAKTALNPTFSFIAFCSGAEIAMAKKDDERLAKQVERMLFVKHLGGFHSGCGWRTPMMRDVLAFALSRGILVAVARTWIREKRIGAPASPPDGWPLSVRIRAADGLAVDVDGAEDARAKPAQKLRELVAVLVAKRGGVTQADLLDWLWPDAEGDKAAASLKAATHRLRQWLGSEAVRVAGGRWSLNPSFVSCDVWREDFAPSEAETVLDGFDAPPVHALRRKLRSSFG